MGNEGWGNVLVIPVGDTRNGEFTGCGLGVKVKTVLSGLNLRYPSPLGEAV